MKNFKDIDSIDLKVKINDHDMFDISKELLENLDKGYEIFSREIIKVKKEWDLFKKQAGKNQITFYPEVLSRMSPMTIINAPWGSGKTFFIESFAKLFILEKIKSINFSKVIIIDAWKYSNAKSIPDEIMSEIFYKIINLGFMIKNKGLKIAKQLFNTTALPWINRFSTFNFKELNTKKESIETLIGSFNSNGKEKKIIIFIDNIERLGKNSWEVLKALGKLSQLKNFLFILPMNADKMHKNQSINDGEFPIEKYTDLKIINFEQDYNNLFNNKGFDKSIINDLCTIFNYKIDGAILSIREINKRMKSNELPNKTFSKYKTFSVIKKYIWGDVSLFAGLIKSDIEDSIKYLNNSYKSWVNVRELVVNSRKHKWPINELRFILKNNNILIFDDQLKETKNYLNVLLEYVSSNVTLIKSLKTKITKNKTNNQKLDRDITVLRENINKEEDKPDNIERETDKIVSWKSEITLKEKYKNDNNGYVSLDNKEIEYKNRIIQEINYFCSKLSVAISNFEGDIIKWKNNVHEDIKSYFKDIFNFTEWEQNRSISIEDINEYLLEYNINKKEVV